VILLTTILFIGYLLIKRKNSKPYTPQQWQDEAENDVEWTKNYLQQQTK
jgi:hypothetical protein